MAHAFETSREDVELVLAAHDLAMELLAIDDLLRRHDYRLTKAALYYLDLEDQGASVLDEIEAIVLEERRLPAGTAKKFPVP